MSAYVVLDIEIVDPEAYETYKRLAPASLALFGGTYVARGGETEMLEGTWNPKRVVILRFESIVRAKQWLESEEYRAARAIRHAAAKTSMIVTEGLE
jgi:uncharacterized protein (DUF1330 family)